MQQQFVIEGRALPEQEKTYLHLPFTMPPAAVRLDIAYAYSERIGSDPTLTGGNTVDLGVFDERGIDFLTAGFRGWSGSERATFTIAEEQATPGYLAGPLLPGVWQVLLGLYKVAPGGCDYRVTVTITTDDGRPGDRRLSPAGAARPDQGAGHVGIAALPSSPPPAPYGPWLRGEMHCHSWHSDGDRSAADVVALARARGLDFLAITDHNTIASHREQAAIPDPGLVLIPGVEVTTFHGHLNVWGIDDWVDFRIESAAQMAQALRFARERGALTACNHPKSFGPNWDYREVAGYDCVEVWNGPWGERNQESLDFWLALLAEGRRVPAVCGSDWHRENTLSGPMPRAPGAPALWVYVPELFGAGEARPSPLPRSAAGGLPSPHGGESVGRGNASAILDAVRRGHVAMSAAPAGPFLALSTSDGAAMGGDALPAPALNVLPLRLRCRGGMGAHLRLLDQTGLLLEQMLLDPDAELQVVLPVPGSLYVRAELRTQEGEMLALTNPIYLVREASAM